jgi:phosphatidylglycerol:prolipoprotein diacylglycerol transferase
MHPFLFQIGHFRVPAYGFFSLLALALAIGVVRRCARLEGINPGEATDAIVLTIAVGYFGARALELALDWRRYFATPGGLKLVFFSTGIFYGGVIVAIPFCLYWFRRVGLPPLQGLDLLALAGASAEAVGRWGCFCSGCCWGTPTDLPWAVTFPELARRLHAGLPAVPLHPTQIYLSLIGWAILGLLILLYRRKRFDGQIIATFVILYSVARFFVEYVRGDAERGLYFGGRLSTSQILAVVLAVAAAIAYVRLARRAQPAASAA